ncbi:MAG: hypothetical protein B7Y95_24250 [Rhizobiales bacterium 32-66-11]|nr:MAG: hypothetical protein B7Y95_24250 [Rhizobiales bacterium 32-66-11]
MYRWRSNDPVFDPDLRELLEIRAALAELSFLVKTLRLCEAVRKANFNPYQPRVPRYRPDGGQWVGPGGIAILPVAFKPRTRRRGSPQLPPWQEGDPPRITITPRVPEIGDNGGPPLEEPPPVPRAAPPTAQDRTQVVKRAASWLLRAVRAGANLRAKLFIGVPGRGEMGH